MALWSFTEFMYRQADNPDTAFLWIKLGSMWPFASSFLLHFVLVFTERIRPPRKNMVYLALHLPALVFSVAGLTTDLMTSKPIKEYWGYTSDVSQVSWLYWGSAIWGLGLAFLGLLLCARYYSRTTDETKKQQAKYVTLGFSIPIFTAFFTEALFPALSFEFPELSATSTVWLSILVAYAIRKHELFTMDPATAAENIISTMPDSLILADPGGKILTVNQSLLDFLNFKEYELIGKSVEELCAEACRDRLLTELLKNGVLRNVETRYRTNLGEEKHVSFSGSMIRSRDGRIVGIVCIVRDITERKEMELEHYSTHLEDLVREGARKISQLERMAAIGETAAMVGHDLRNPLQVVANTLYLAKKRLDTFSLPPEKEKSMAELLDILKVQAAYMNKIVSDLQDFARPLKLELGETDLKQLVNDVLNSVAFPQSVNMSTMFEEGFPRLMVDSELMKRVFVNLVTNASQAMPDGGRLTIKAYLSEDAAIIDVQDTGVGIPKENLPKLFQPLFTTKAKGQGFGLAVCKRVIEGHGGNITCESKVGEGTTFKIKIPLRGEQNLIMIPPMTLANSAISGQPHMQARL